MIKQVCRLMVEDPFGWENHKSGGIFHPGTGIHVHRTLNKWFVDELQVGWIAAWRLRRAFLLRLDAKAVRWEALQADAALRRALEDHRA